MGGKNATQRERGLAGDPETASASPDATLVPTVGTEPASASQFALVPEHGRGDDSRSSGTASGTDAELVGGAESAWPDAASIADPGRATLEGQAQDLATASQSTVVPEQTRGADIGSVTPAATGPAGGAEPASPDAALVANPKTATLEVAQAQTASPDSALTANSGTPTAEGAQELEPVLVDWSAVVPEMSHDDDSRSGGIASPTDVGLAGGAETSGASLDAAGVVDCGTLEGAEAPEQRRDDSIQLDGMESSAAAGLAGGPGTSPASLDAVLVADSGTPAPEGAQTPDLVSVPQSSEIAEESRAASAAASPHEDPGDIELPPGDNASGSNPGGLPFPSVEEFLQAHGLGRYASRLKAEGLDDMSVLLNEHLNVGDIVTRLAVPKVHAAALHKAMDEERVAWTESRKAEVAEWEAIFAGEWEDEGRSNSSFLVKGSTLLADGKNFLFQVESATMCSIQLDSERYRGHLGKDGRSIQWKDGHDSMWRRKTVVGEVGQERPREVVRGPAEQAALRQVAKAEAERKKAAEERSRAEAQIFILGEAGTRRVEQAKAAVSPKERLFNDLRRSPAKAAATQGLSLYVVGPWNSWDPQKAKRMTWDAQRGCWLGLVPVQDDQESFQIWMGGDAKRCIHPSVNDANEAVAWSPCGPDPNGDGRNWTIRRRLFGRRLSWFQVRLYVTDGAPTDVLWEEVFLPHSEAHPSVSGEGVEHVNREELERLERFEQQFEAPKEPFRLGEKRPRFSTPLATS